MSKTTPVNKPTYGLLHSNLERLDSLAELALDISWSRPHAAEAGASGATLDKLMQDKLIEHRQHHDEHGEGIPLIRYWRWNRTNE